MRISAEKLLETAEATGFRPEILEKVLQLMHLLQALKEHPDLEGKFVLKGGTALNLFFYDIPRLSVDIDLNYVGARDVDEMKAERPDFERNIETACSREGFVTRRVPQDHAGGKWRLRYPGSYGGEGNLEMDINYLFRVPLWPVEYRSSCKVGLYEVGEIPLASFNEIAAGKLAALLSRGKARDLFDCYQLPGNEGIDLDSLGVAFIVLGGMNRRDWRTVSAEDVRFDGEEFKRQLLPMLRSGKMGGLNAEGFGKEMVNGCKEALGALLPFQERELEFLNRLLDCGDIAPELLTDDGSLQEKIKTHPGLLWKSVNVKKYKGIHHA